MKAGAAPNPNMLNHVTNGTEFFINDFGSSAATCSNAILTASLEPPANVDDSLSEICEIRPLHVLSNVHQSGVNCLHVSDIRDCQISPSGLLFNIISGGDDQALYYLGFKLTLMATFPDNEFMAPDIRNSNGGPGITNNLVNCRESQVENYKIKFLYHAKIASAHSSAVKGKITISYA